MANPFILTLQNTKSLKEKANTFRRFQIHRWSNQGEDKNEIQSLLQVLDKELIPQVLHLSEVKMLLNASVFEETKDYLVEALRYRQKPEVLAQIYYLLARCCHGQGNIEDALSYLNKALEWQTHDLDCWNLQADCFLEIGEWEAAVNSLNKCLRSSPGDDETLFRLGSIYLYYEEYQEAFRCFSGCCKLNALNPNYWEMKAEMLIKLNQIEAACLCYRKAIKLNGETHLYTRLAYCYAQTAQLTKAKKLLVKVLKIQPDDYDALSNLAGIYNKLNENEKAYPLLKKAYTINCNDPILLNNLGYICFQLGRARKAIEYYREALKIRPDDKIVMYNLGVCLSEKGFWEEAQEVLENLTQFDRQHTGAWALLGNVYEKLAKHTLAVDCFNQSLGLV